MSYLGIQSYYAAGIRLHKPDKHFHNRGPFFYASAYTLQDNIVYIIYS